jgi:hypothetical protein
MATAIFRPRKEAALFGFLPQMSGRVGGSKSVKKVMRGTRGTRVIKMKGRFVKLYGAVFFKAQKGWYINDSGGRGFKT